MANAHHPGGGYMSGAAAQEENLFRRSNLFEHLVNPKNSRRVSFFKYPIPDLAAVYTPSASVFRGEHDIGYPFLPVPRRMAFIAAAAYNRPDISFGMLTPSFEGRTKRKIRVILKVAQAHGHDSIVLGAFGCGAFRNPAEHVSKLFREVIHREFRYAFKVIVFAIYEDGNSTSDINPRGNGIPFAEAFGVPLMSVSEYVTALASHRVP